MNSQLLTIALPLLAYFVGAIPFGLIIVLWVSRSDIRQAGSGNIGATNVRRTAGTFWGVVTLVCDALKGLLPTWLALGWGPSDSAWLAPLVALTAICGHMFPVYLKFKPSGKGVATALGCFSILAPVACGLSLIVFIIMVVIKRYVSLASMVATALLPLLVWWTTGNLYLTVSSLLSGVLILLRHRTNIRRLVQGKESTLGK
jgi:glycerol-3-phosphate acyltransferase PlsY